MDLDKFAVGKADALLINDRSRAARINGRVCALSIDHAGAAGGNDQRITAENTYFHGGKILRDTAAANALIVDNGFQEFPAFVFFNFSFIFKAAYLLIQGILQLLTRRGTGKDGTALFRAAETAQIQKTFAGTRKMGAHAIESID